MPKKIIARKGDCIASIAAAHGFTVDVIWNHADNTDLRKLRKSPSILFVGDVVMIPDKQPKDMSAATEQTHRFTKKSANTHLNATFTINDEPMSNMTFVLSYEGIHRNENTDGDGHVDLQLPANVKAVDVSFVDSDTKFILTLGGLDPVTETRGIQQRLQNLGYFYENIDGRQSESLTNAVIAFQKHHMNSSLGVVNDDTRQKLVELYGS